MASIGFVGLGHMGLPMAINLLKAGHQVTGFDLQDLPQKKLKEAGGFLAANLTELANNKDFLITMLQTGQQVIQVCESKNGLFQQAKKQSLFIDCSTIDVQSAHIMHELAKTHQLLALDAPVSGGVAGAAAGTLTFMVGGEPLVFEKAQPILAAMGKKIIHTGKAGSGQAAKTCNNMILGISMIAVSEAFTLANALGLSADKLFEVVNNASGQCWAMSQYVPVPHLLENVPANNEYKPGFAANMMLKDLKLSQEAAKAKHIQTPLGEQSTALYQKLIDEGYGDLDFSAIIQLISQHKER